MKDKIAIVFFCTIIYGFFIFNLLMKDNDLSIEERRHLKQFPEFSVSSMIEGTWFSDFETYTLDQFPLRQSFRTVKAKVQYQIFGKLDNNDLFVKDNRIFKIEYPLDEKSVERFIKKVNNIVDTYFQDRNIYYAIVPDKNYYLYDSKYLKMDYDRLYDIVKKGLSKFHYIELRDLLSLEDYYDTDTHWRQEKIIEVAEKLEKSMTGSVSNHQYQKVTYQPFYGVYYGQAALGGKGEELIYLSNETIKQAYVENGTSFHQVYELEELGGMDSYNVFLSGSKPLIKIENKNHKTGKELIIFRDSFASSLTPLLLEKYSKITLIDLRYMSSSQLKDMISSENTDILFLYSTMIINQSVMLK